MVAVSEGSFGSLRVLWWSLGVPARLAAQGARFQALGGMGVGLAGTPHCTEWTFCRVLWPLVRLRRVSVFELWEVTWQEVNTE